MAAEYEQLRKSCEFYKNRAQLIASKFEDLLASRDAKVNDLATQLHQHHESSQNVLAGMQYLHDDQIASLQAEIAGLHVRLQSESEPLQFDPVPPASGRSGGVPLSGNNNREAENRWQKCLREAMVVARSSLSKSFPEPEWRRAVFLQIAAEDLTPEDFRTLLAKRPDKLDCIPEKFLDDTVRQGQTDFRDYMQSFLTPELGENLCKTLLLSRKKYERMNEKIFGTITQDENGRIKSTPQMFNGVLAPQLPGRHKRAEYRRMILEAFEHEVEDDGLSTSLNVRLVLVASIKQSLLQGYMQVVDGWVKQLNGQDPQVMKYTDTANQFKGMKVTASAVQLPYGSSAPNSPFHTSEYALYEGGDGYEDLTTLGRWEVAQANDLLAQPILDLGPLLIHLEGPLLPGATRDSVMMNVRCMMNFNIGGDQSHSNSSNCLSGCNCSNPCVYCEATKDEMCSLDWEKTWGVRTRRRIMLLAHTVVGVCPGCKMEIVAEEQLVVNPNLQCVIAAEGDDEPGLPHKFVDLNKRPSVTWTSLHLGVVYGRTPPYEVDPDNWILCLLHLNLCIVRGLFERTIVLEIGKLPRDGSFEKLVDAFADLLRVAGLRMKKSKLKRTGKQVDTFDERLKNSGMGGRDAENVMNARVALLKLMFPEATRGPYIPDETLFASEKSFHEFYEAAEEYTDLNLAAIRKALDVRRAWHTWDTLWKLLQTGMDYPGGDVSMLTLEEVKQVWAKRADEVEVMAKAFLAHWVSAHKATQGLYLHHVARHLPDQIRKFGDLRNRQTQGLEHCHHTRKEVGTHATNRKPGERLETMMAHSTVKRALLQGDELERLVGQAEDNRKSKARYGKRVMAKQDRLDVKRMRLDEDFGADLVEQPML